MKEKKRDNQEQQIGGGNSDGFFPADAEDTPALVSVSSGPYVEHLPVGNMSVGEIRKRFKDRLDIDPASIAVLDGDDVKDDAVVKEGQALTFMHRAGEKGATVPPIVIDGETISTITPEGKRASMPVDKFLTTIRNDDREMIIAPPGVTPLVKDGMTIWIYQREPKIYRFKWLAKDSPATHGLAATYRTVKIALPYLIMLAAFCSECRLQIPNAVYFSNKPLTDPKDQLCLPALPNILAGYVCPFICTKGLSFMTVNAHPNPSRRMRAGLTALVNCLLEPGFNGDGGSPYYPSHAPAQITPIEQWEEESSKDPLFALNVKWTPAEQTVNQAANALFGWVRGHHSVPQSASDIAQIILNAKP